MSKKFLHVKDGVVVAVTLEGEVAPRYSDTVVEVALDAEVGVGDKAPEADEAPVADVKKKKAAS